MNIKIDNFSFKEYDLQQLFKAQQEAFLQEMQPNLKIRIDRIDRIAKMTEMHKSAILDAIITDYGCRSRAQTELAEILMIDAEVKHTKKHLANWMSARNIPTALQFLPGKNRLIRQGLGVIGVISPWNYPWLLALSPTIGALAAGNRVMIKPSELTPTTSSLMKELIERYFSPTEVCIINGDSKIGMQFASLPFNHLVFTGSTQIGRIVAQSAAKNLTPVTLELGGKSPVIIDRSASLATIVKRIAHTKLFNSGQTCIAPDYILIPAELESQFVTLFQSAVRKMYPNLLTNPDYTSIINSRHFERLQALIDDAHLNGADIITINPDNQPLDPARRKIAPTLICKVNETMKIMQEEIFGPLLPILSYKTPQEAIDYINCHDRPLALYWMGDDTDARDYVLANTISGGVTINDCMWHIAQENQPFGGVGASGNGAYHGQNGFITFSKEKPIFYQSRLNGLSLMTPPFGKIYRLIIALLKKLI